MDVDFSAFEHVALFARGEAYQTRPPRSWRTLFQPRGGGGAHLPPARADPEAAPHPRLGGRVDTDHVFAQDVQGHPADRRRHAPARRSRQAQPARPRQDRRRLPQRHGHDGLQHARASWHRLFQAGPDLQDRPSPPWAAGASRLRVQDVLSTTGRPGRRTT